MGPQNLKLFSHSCYPHEIFRIEKNDKKTKFGKVWGYQNERISLKQGCKNSTFNHLRWTDEIFRIGRYDGKIKFNKIWGVTQWGSHLNEDVKIQNFLNM